ncbi:MAG: HD domain-containing protein [Desulfobacteraceae bacterium]|jgi:HD-GYP domain-containing protein (c-di-GMP phosphodiesterase class II)
MTAQSNNERLHTLFSSICVNLAAGLRSLSLYPPEHPETQKKAGDLVKGLSTYLQEQPTLTLVLFKGEAVVENTPLPELSENLAQFIAGLEAMKLQRLVFHRGVTLKEILLFLQMLLPLLKNPNGADLVISKNQDKLPHIVAGSLPLEGQAGVSYEDLSGAPQASRHSVLSFADQLKDLFAGLVEPLSGEKVGLAKEITDTIRGMNISEELPLKGLIYRRSPDPDPYIHAINVSALSMALIERLEPGERHVHEVGLGALLHDIGLHVPLSDPQSNTAGVTLDEKKRQWEHPIRGAEILMASPGMPEIPPIVCYEHHLHYNGGGYPKQKRPRDLNLASLITFITDTYDNLRRNRPGRDALSLSDTLNWMDRKAGTLFHPLLLKRFRALVKAQAEVEE